MQDPLEEEKKNWKMTDWTNKTRRQFNVMISCYAQVIWHLCAYIVVFLLNVNDSLTLYFIGIWVSGLCFLFKLTRWVIYYRLSREYGLYNWVPRGGDITQYFCPNVWELHWLSYSHWLNVPGGLKWLMHYILTLTLTQSLTPKIKKERNSGEKKENLRDSNCKTL